LKKAGGVMVFVDADPKIRYERMRGRARDAETELTFEEFLANEQKEISGAKTASDQNLDAVKKMSDLYLENNGTKDEFFETAIGELS
jgi:dephospho-CoA kinase